MTLQSLARTIAKARHGTDAMWANYMGAAEAVVKEFEAIAAGLTPLRDDLFIGFAADADGIEDNIYLDPDEARIAFRAMLRALIARRPAAQ